MSAKVKIHETDKEIMVDGLKDMFEERRGMLIKSAKNRNIEKRGSG